MKFAERNNSAGIKLLLDLLLQPFLHPVKLDM